MLILSVISTKMSKVKDVNRTFRRTVLMTSKLISLVITMRVKIIIKHFLKGLEYG